MAEVKWYGDKAIKSIEEAISKALEASALIVHGQAVNLSPVGRYPQGSGKVGVNLRNSISYSLEGRVEGLNSASGQKASPDEAVKVHSEINEAIIGSSCEYAPYVELGTSKMAAQPYLNPALEINKDNIREIFAAALKEATKD